MIINKEVEKKFEKIVDLVDELRREFWGVDETQESKTVFDLEIGDTYYSLNTTGRIGEETWDDTTLDYECRWAGNMFLTKQDAEDELRVRQLVMRAKRSQKGFKPCIGICSQEVYRLFYGEVSQEVLVTSVDIIVWRTRLGFWDNEDDAQKFLEDNKGDLEWYFKEYKG